MNDYTREALDLSAVHEAEFCGIRKKYEEGAKLCCFELNEGYNIPFNADTYGYPEKGIRKGRTVRIRLVLFSDDGEGEIFHDEEEYYRERKNSMAAESMIPCGTFPVPSNAEDFEESARLIMHGKIASIEHVVIGGIESLNIGLQCLGVIYDFFIDEGVLPFIEVGNVLSSVFYAICKIEK